MSPSRAPSRRIVRQLGSFGAIGVVSTLAYLGLYLALRVAAPPAVANALALVITALGNTAANRRWTFEVRGSDGLAGDHAAGLVAFLAALGISSAALAVLQVLAPTAGRPVELGVLLSANVVSTAVRFAMLRSWFSSRRLVTLERRADGSGR